MGADLTSTDVNEGYIKHIKFKINSEVQHAAENNMPLSQGITNNSNEEALASAATSLSLFSPPIDNSNSYNLSQFPVKMKCYYDHTHCCILDYFNDPILDDAVIYTGDIPFQYNKIDGRYTEFIGKSIGTAFMAAKKRSRISSQSR